MDNKYKNKTLKHLERNEPKSIYSMPLTTLLAKGRDSFSLANNAFKVVTIIITIIIIIIFLIKDTILNVEVY